MIELTIRKTLPGFTLDIALRSEAGIVALFGRSGAGKSMTLSIIAGLQRAEAGHLRVDGATLFDREAGIELPAHRRRVGLVFQDSHLLPHLSVRQNLLFGRWFAPRAERRVALEPVVETLGIGALLQRRPASLSGGERQRVAIGRALLASPRLLLFDEPLAALDRQRKLDILPLIERLRDEFAIPIVYVSHARDEVLRLAAHVCLIENGTVVASGDPAEVLGSSAATEDLRFGRVSVIAATVEDIDAAFGLTRLRHPAGTLWLAAEACPAGRTVRVLVRATDVTLAARDPGPISTRSMLAGIVASVEEEGPFAAVSVALRGHGTLLALVTRRSLHELKLSTGSPVIALIKTVAVDEELAVATPRSSRPGEHGGGAA